MTEKKLVISVRMSENTG